MRNVLYAASASSRLCCAYCRWSSRIFVSSVSFSRFNWPATSTNRATVALTMLAIWRGLVPCSATDRKLPLDPNGNFLSVALHGTSPRQIANIVNATVARFVEVAGQLKREKLTELTKILEDQRQYAQHSLDEAEAAYKTFRMRTITLPSDQPVGPRGTAGVAESRDPVVTDFFDRQSEREHLRLDRAAILRAVGQPGDSTLPVDAFAAIASVQHSPELSNALKELSDKQAQLRMLRYHYSDAYAPLQQLVGEIAQLEQRTI